ncbi:MAG: OmpA family protein [Desulfuromonadaceae bacterium]|jgi:outer membrane protein OmpA-like peptidoglycan-associated protein
MKRMCGFALLLLGLVGCGGKENLIVLMPDADGTVGSMALQNEGGEVVLDEKGKAIWVKNRQSQPSAPVVVSEAETQALFQAALDAQPLPPQNFLLYFKFDTDQPTLASQELMAAIMESIRERDSHDISVIGHTDRAGDRVYNLKLSLQRAEVVRDYLVAQGISPDFIQLSSHGEGNPLIPTADNVAEARNRRVEVLVR